MIADLIAALLQSLVDLSSTFVMPDWGALVGLLPIFIVLGVVGPIVTLLVLVWLLYVVRRPRASVAIEDGPQRAPIAEDGSVAFPVGLPYCTADRLVHASGANRCRDCGADLAVICPLCGLGRSAGLDTCGNCGLVLRIEPRARVLRRSGPPPGGAALA